MRAHKFSNTQKPKEEQAKRHELCFLDFKKKILRRIYMFWIELVILLLLRSEEHTSELQSRE